YKTKNQIELYRFFHVVDWKSDLVHFHLNLQVANARLSGLVYLETTAIILRSKTQLSLNALSPNERQRMALNFC
ncbi:hypothetical protein ACFO4O_15055, partial [Glaciecola siphonariae]